MLASGVVLGVAAGLAFGGRLERLSRLKINWWPVLAVGVGLRVLSPNLGDWALPAYVAAFLGVIAVAVAERHLPGMLLIAIGALMNVTVILLNAGMPIDPAAAAVAGIRIRDDGLHVAADASTRLGFLADVIPVAVFGHVYSAGDVALALGGFWLPFTWLRRS